MVRRETALLGARSFGSAILTHNPILQVPLPLTGGGLRWYGNDTMKSAYQLTLDGIPIAVERRRIKNMYLRVQPDGRVLLNAPRLMPDFVIERFARARLPWLTKRLQACAPQPAPTYETGETVLLWGKPYRLQVESGGKRAHVETDGDALYVRVPENAPVGACMRALDNFFRKQLSEAVTRLAPECERITGKRASQWRIRDMKTRWGTCNTQSAAVTLNLQLARRDPVYLRYVMLHELTHLWEPSHNARFYAYMDRFCPDWKRIRKQLKAGA